MKKIDLKGTVCGNRVGKLHEKYGFSVIYPEKVIDALNEADGDDVEVDLNSPGGNVDYAREIYTALMTYKGNVKIHVVGLAASAASMIMCARYCDISPVGQVMIHCTSTYAEGNHNDMEKTAEMLQSYDNTIVPAYVKKTGRSREEILSMMENESWITAEEAVKMGFCDAIITGADNSENKKADFSADCKKTAENKAKAEARMKYLALKGAVINGY